jgi:hypothetical protein
MGDTIMLFISGGSVLVERQTSTYTQDTSPFYPRAWIHFHISLILHNQQPQALQISESSYNMSAEQTKLEVPTTGERPESTTSTLRGEDNLQEKKKEEGQLDEDVETGTVQGNTDSDDPGEDEYPTGINMFFIVLALVMAVFLFSLDLVRYAFIPVKLV